MKNLHFDLEENKIKRNKKEVRNITSAEKEKKKKTSQNIETNIHDPVRFINTDTVCLTIYQSRSSVSMLVCRFDCPTDERVLQNPFLQRK